MGSLDDVHGPLEHERPASPSLQGPWVLILGQPPRYKRDGLDILNPKTGQRTTANLDTLIVHHFCITLFLYNIIKDYECQNEKYHVEDPYQDKIVGDIS